MANICTSFLAGQEERLKKSFHILADKNTPSKNNEEHKKKACLYYNEKV